MSSKRLQWVDDMRKYVVYFAYQPRATSAPAYAITNVLGAIVDIPGARALFKLQRERGIDTEALARLSGVPIERLQKILRQGGPTLLEAMAIAKGLNIPVYAINFSHVLPRTIRVDPIPDSIVDELSSMPREERVAWARKQMSQLISIHRARTKAGLRQDDVSASGMALDQSNISRAETGEVQATWRTILIVAEATGTHPMRLDVTRVTDLLTAIITTEGDLA
jgi:transcriptional regulator with XRE-family HTH domain